MVVLFCSVGAAHPWQSLALGLTAIFIAGTKFIPERADAVIEKNFEATYRFN